MMLVMPGFWVGDVWLCLGCGLVMLVMPGLWVGDVGYAWVVGW